MDTPASKGTSTAGSSSQKKKKFHLKKSIAFATVCDAEDVCAICIRDINALCEYCSGKEKEKLFDDCDISISGCGHKFHQHCIDTWIRRNPTCPLDRKPFEVTGVVKRA